jgi:putative metallohydrolase (TIGR04338 family)
VRRYDDALPTSTIYAVERNVAEAVQRGGEADFFGSRLDLDRCHVQEIQPAMLPVWQGIVNGLYESRRSDVRQQPPTLRISTRAYRRAWYSTAAHEIVLPQQRWSLNSWVLLHELAHALTDGGHNQRSAHGRLWRQTYCNLVYEVIGPEASLLLMSAMDL